MRAWQIFIHICCRRSVHLPSRPLSFWSRSCHSGCISGTVARRSQKCTAERLSGLTSILKSNFQHKTLGKQGNDRSSLSRNCFSAASPMERARSVTAGASQVHVATAQRYLSIHLRRRFGAWLLRDDGVRRRWRGGLHGLLARWSLGLSSGDRHFGWLDIRDELECRRDAQKDLGQMAIVERFESVGVRSLRCLGTEAVASVAGRQARFYLCSRSLAWSERHPGGR